MSGLDSRNTPVFMVFCLFLFIFIEDTDLANIATIGFNDAQGEVAVDNERKLENSKALKGVLGEGGGAPEGEHRAWRAPGQEG